MEARSMRRSAPAFFKENLHDVAGRGVRGGNSRGGHGRGRGRALHLPMLSAHKGAKKRRGELDMGCSADDPAMTVLPWATPGQSGLPPERTPWTRPLPPYLRTAPRRCAVLIDRHVHKNGGSTVRDLLLEHERMGLALYQGYTQMYWQRDYQQLRGVASEAIARNATPGHVLLVEAEPPRS